MASLLVVQGADQGKRFDLKGSGQTLGRDGTNPIRLHDTEISRRHAEVRPGAEAGTFELVDLGSANGTYLNDQLISGTVPLKAGDMLRLGQTVLVFGGPSVESALTSKVSVIERLGSAATDRSEIVKALPAAEGTRLLRVPETAGDWLKARLTHLATIYQATQAVSRILDTEALLPEILQLAFETTGADRGAALLLDEAGVPVPKAVRWRRGEPATGETLAISRTIVDFVLEQGQGVLTSDAPADARFGPAPSIVSHGIREALCVPIQGRHSRPGVLYVDVQVLADPPVPTSAHAPAPAPWSDGTKSRFSPDHLALMIAIGHQAGLALESTTFYEAKLQAERLAAVGQTIANLSHHIKNILQGLRGGSSLIDLGLNQRNDEIVRKGWSILERNQTRIYNLVMDMLSFSKDREPAWEEVDLNETLTEVVDLMRTRAGELGVTLHWLPDPTLPAVRIDPEGIHRAVLNLVTNALDACEGRPDPTVTVRTARGMPAEIVSIAVQDNGVGIPASEIGTIFQVFASTKGSRGTGLGLPVSQKIVREHGGTIRVESEVGVGTNFVIELPLRRGDVSSSGRPEDLTAGIGPHPR